MNNFLGKIWYFLFSNIMWLYLVMGICSIFGFHLMIFQLMMFVNTLFLMYNFNKIKFSNLLDIFVVLYIVWIVINSICIDYPHHWHLWYNSIMTNMLPLLFYFTAKTVNVEIEDILKKFTVPIVISMIFGLVFYYTEPSWYTAIKMAQVNSVAANGEISDELMIEIFRFSSFWATPYVIGYAAMYYADYNLEKIFSDNTHKKHIKKNFFLFLLSAVAILLTQFRASIYALIVTIIYLALLAKNKIKISYILIIVVFGIFTIAYLFNENTDIGMSFRERMVKGVDSEHLEERFEYTGRDADLTTLEGLGYGRFGPRANEYGMFSVQDSEYQKVQAELGHIGFALFIGIIATSLLISFRKKHLQLEFIIILFFAIAFVGSSCISASTTFPFIFWYVLGRISIKKNNSHKKITAK